MPSSTAARALATNCESGPALTITEGLSVGMASCTIPTLVLGAAILVAYEVAGFYGVALAAFGMLSTTTLWQQYLCRLCSRDFGCFS